MRWGHGAGAERGTLLSPSLTSCLHAGGPLCSLGLSVPTGIILFPWVWLGSVPCCPYVVDALGVSSFTLVLFLSVEVCTGQHLLLSVTLR